MRKIKYLILTFVMAISLLPINVFAAGNISVSTTNINIVNGKSKSFTITANNAAGRVDISSSNPQVATVSTSSLFLDMQSNTVTVTGKSVGSATIKVYVTDATTYDDEDLTGKTYIINVNVTNPTTNNNTKPVNNLSQNNNIKELFVEGYELVKVDNNYTLVVNTDVTSININATAEDSKSSISGTGSHQLNIGENNIEIIITSESGAQNKINIKVTRKDGYYLEDLESLLNSENQDINIIINSDSKITSEELTKIKDSKKKVNLNYYDENKKLIYSWLLDGTKIKDTNEFLTSISYISEYVKEISKLSNYADGLYINFKHSGDLPNGTKIKLYVGDKFENGNLVKVYHYDENKKTLDFIQDNLKITEGYIEFDIENCSEYFVTMSNINNSNVKTSNSSILFVILLSVELIIIIALIIMFIFKIMPINKQKKDKNISENLDN